MLSLEYHFKIGIVVICIRNESFIFVYSRWDNARRNLIQSPPDPMSPDPTKQTVVANNYLLGPSTDVLNQRLMAVLSHLLISGPSSPFFKSLIETNTGLNYSPGAGFNGSGKEAIFSIGLKGVKSGDVEKVVSTIQDTFKKVNDWTMDKQYLYNIFLTEFGRRIRGRSN